VEAGVGWAKSDYMPKIVFLDTNIYLHYRDFDQIDWPTVLGTDAVTIIIPPITLRELNKHKDSNTINPRIRKRAGATLKKLAELFETSSQAQLRANTTVRHEANDPIDFKSHNLNPEIQDDHLIASTIMCRDEMHGTEIILVTADSGLILLGKARLHEITTTKLPNEFKLPEEPDPEQKHINELEQENRELKSKIPKLSLTFDNDSNEQHAKFTVPYPPIELTEAQVTSEVDSLQKSYPKMPLPQTHKQQSELSLLNELYSEYSKFFSASPEDISRYNAELDEFYKKYAAHLQRVVNYQNMTRRTIELKTWLANHGNAPAEDIDIFMNFPSGLIVRRNLPQSPIPPEPPPPPKPSVEILALPQAITGGAFPHTFPDISSARYLPANVSTPAITYTPSPEVHIHIGKSKHNLPESLDALFVTLGSFDEARPFHIDYRILDANTPMPTLGRLHIIIRKENQGATP
jgi:hypothetical protein